ncbi:hypothetical protein, partial [Sinorhizobium meliloti]|uniref:hypothetical protein n=1 Tax=Rhizobium meliloti TaxID=382 RepID=UPI001F160CDB
ISYITDEFRQFPILQNRWESPNCRALRGFSAPTLYSFPAPAFASTFAGTSAAFSGYSYTAAANRFGGSTSKRALLH